jgi:lysophospholipase L1-like esterase
VKSVLLFIVFYLGYQAQPYAQTYEIPDEVNRILFIGNSITYGGTYIECIDAYLSVHYPGKQYEVINAGLPSETVSGLSEKGHANGAFPRPDLHERLKRVLDEVKPDLVLASYGMNDGIYLPYDDKRFKKFRKGIKWLHKEVEKTGAQIIHITPTIYRGKNWEAYANVLDIYSDWLISHRYTDQWKVINLHWPMAKHLEDQQQLNPDFVFTRDGVHPNKSGHFFMAKQILLGLGESNVVAAENVVDLFRPDKTGLKIFELVNKQQQIEKDAWLTLTGHSRPRMNVGLTMDEAIKKSAELDKQIQILLQQ